MTGLLLLGLAPAAAAPLADPPHLRLGGPGFDALALPLASFAGAEGEAWAVAAALAQNAVLSAYAATGDVLPVALGAGFSGRAALGRYLEANAAALEAAMRRLAGQAEYLVQLLPAAPPPDPEPPPDPAPDPAGGGAWLRRRGAAREQRRSLGRARQLFAEALAAELGRSPGARALLARPLKPGGALLDLRLLLERGQSAALIDGLRGRGGAAGALGLRLRLIGPCPPHSFVGGACVGPGHVEEALVGEVGHG